MTENSPETGSPRKEFKIGDPHPRDASKIDELRWLRDAWIDEIPDRIIHLRGH